MAVKQYSNETSNQQQERPENLKYNIMQVLEYIDELERNQIQARNPIEVQNMCLKIVDLLGIVEVPTVPTEVSAFQKNIKRVDEYLENLIKTDHTQETIFACLRELYKMMMNGKSSSAAGIILHLCKPARIADATKKFVNMPETSSDEEIRRGIGTLCHWLLSSFFIRDLNLWIIGILEGLRNQRKFELLMEIAADNIDQIIRSVQFPYAFHESLAVLMHILASVQHTPMIFHKCLRKFPVNKYTTKPEWRPLLDLISALTYHFPDNEQYKSIILPESCENVKEILLNKSPWHDQIKYERRNTNARVGLVNLGNTCYMNSVLQALVMTKQFTRDLLLTDNRTPLFQNMQKLLALLLHSERPQLTPNSVLQTARPPGFHPGHEQDSSEFLGHLLDRLHELEVTNSSAITMVKQHQMHDDRRIDEMMDIDDNDVGAGGGIDVNVSTNLNKIDNIDDYDDDDNGGGGVGGDNQVDGARALASQGAYYISEQQLPGGSGGTVATRQIRPKTLIQKSFGGRISITYKCLNCGNESKHFDTFRDLHLSFPADSDLLPPSTRNCSSTSSVTSSSSTSSSGGSINTALPSTSGAGGGSRRHSNDGESYSVQDLLDFYCSKEKLDEDNKYYCDFCKSLCVGERFINIVQPPRNLILTLKHFKYDQKYNMRAKLMHKVCHEEVISVKVQSRQTMEDFIINYRLYAAVVHSGVSMETGHYFTYGSDTTTGWYKFDDNYVSKSTLSELHNLQPPHTPYILFYQMIPPNNMSNTPPSSSSTPLKTPSTSSSSSSSSSSSLLSSPASSAPPTSSSLMNINNNNNNNTINIISLYEYPALEDLPPQLREYVNRDNITYIEETRLLNNKSTRNVWLRNRKNDFYGGDDNDDQPPPSNSSCGGGFAPSYNQFIK